MACFKQLLQDTQRLILIHTCAERANLVSPTGSAVLVKSSLSNYCGEMLKNFQLVFVGIGAIIGTGIFVLSGLAAAKNAGPAVTISFVIAAIAAGKFPD